MIKIPINIKHLDDADANDITRMTAEQIFKLLKENKDKAYSVLDMQNSFNLHYQRISSAIRTLRRVYADNIQYKWIRLSGHNRCLYYAYKDSQNTRKVKEDE